MYKETNVLSSGVRGDLTKLEAVKERHCEEVGKIMDNTVTNRKHLTKLIYLSVYLLSLNEFNEKGNAKYVTLRTDIELSCIDK